MTFRDCRGPSSSSTTSRVGLPASADERFLGAEMEVSIIGFTKPEPWGRSGAPGKPSMLSGQVCCSSIFLQARICFLRSACRGSSSGLGFRLYHRQNATRLKRIVVFQAETCSSERIFRLFNDL